MRLPQPNTQTTHSATIGGAGGLPPLSAMKRQRTEEGGGGGGGHHGDASSAAMEVSMGLFYGCGLVFAVSGAVILLLDFWRLITGQMSSDELVGIRESEEVPHGDSKSA